MKIYISKHEVRFSYILTWWVHTSLGNTLLPCRGTDEYTSLTMLPHTHTSLQRSDWLYPPHSTRGTTVWAPNTGLNFLPVDTYLQAYFTRVKYMKRSTVKSLSSILKSLQLVGDQLCFSRFGYPYRGTCCRDSRRRCRSKISKLSRLFCVKQHKSFQQS